MAQALHTMTPAQLREAYRQIGLRSGLTPAKFNERVASILADHNIDASNPEDARPLDFVTAAQMVAVPCARCAGTGEFITYVENGVPKGPGGICFRCEGKGYQTDADRRRNYGYDNYAPIPGL